MLTKRGVAYLLLTQQGRHFLKTMIPSRKTTRDDHKEQEDMMR